MVIKVENFSRQKQFQIDRYEGKHPTEELIGTTPGRESERFERSRKRAARKEKQRRKNEMLRAKREQTLPISQRTGVLSELDERAESFDDPGQTPFFDNTDYRTKR